MKQSEKFEPILILATEEGPTCRLRRFSNPFLPSCSMTTSMMCRSLNVTTPVTYRQSVESSDQEIWIHKKIWNLFSNLPTGDSEKMKRTKTFKYVKKSTKWAKTMQSFINDQKTWALPETTSFSIGRGFQVFKDGVVVFGRKDDLLVVQLTDLLLQLVVQVLVRQIRFFRKVSCF